MVAQCTVDLRPGGLMHYRLRSPEGGDLWGRFLYREIVKPEKLVWVNSFSDEKGGVTRHPMAPGWPREMLTTVTFAEQGKGTLITVSWVPINATDDERRLFDERPRQHEPGLERDLRESRALPRAMSAAPGARRREYIVNAERVFEAPRDRVFAAWTRAEHLAHWFGPRGFTIHSCEARRAARRACFACACARPAGRTTGCAAAFARSRRPDAS